MKSISHIKLESSIVSSALFVAGIITSAGALYQYEAGPGNVTMIQICIHVGLTFLMGLLAIHFTARSVRQTVVYLMHKKEEDDNTEITSAQDNQLAMDVIDDILMTKENTSQKLLNELSKQLEAGQAGLYVLNDKRLELTMGYALGSGESDRYSCSAGEGLVGRVAVEGKTLYVDKLPEGYITIHSGLGSASPKYLAIVPIIAENEVRGVLEIALFKPLNPGTIVRLENIGKAWAEAGL